MNWVLTTAEIDSLTVFPPSLWGEAFLTSVAAVAVALLSPPCLLVAFSSLLLPLSLCCFLSLVTCHWTYALPWSSGWSYLGSGPFLHIRLSQRHIQGFQGLGCGWLLDTAINPPLHSCLHYLPSACWPAFVKCLILRGFFCCCMFVLPDLLPTACVPGVWAFGLF